MNTNVWAVYFSPTYSSKKNAISIAEEFGKVSEIDITQKNPDETTFTKDDIVVFGSPVYGGRIPNLAMEKFKHFKGDNTKCVLTVTYGNRDYDDALLELFDMATENGFVVVGCASLIAEHTYGVVQVGRPNAEDISQHKLFAKQVIEKLQKNDLTAPTFKGNRPYKTGGTGGKFRPLTNDDLCVNCGLCTKKCPVYAIANDNKTIDNNKCIACFRCIKSCPTNAKYMDTPEYNLFARAFSQKLENARENEYFI